MDLKSNSYCFNYFSLDLFDDIKAFYQLKISNTKSFLEVLRSLIANVEQFGYLAETDIFNNMEISILFFNRLVKQDIQRITSAGKMVDRAKQGYVNVRKREFEVELNQKLEESVKKEMIDFIKDEKKWAQEGLIHEVNEFNDTCKFADENFDQFLFNKDDFHLQMEIRCKKGFIEMVEESKRLNEVIFEEMKGITNRITKDVDELVKIDEKNIAERTSKAKDNLTTKDSEDKENDGENKKDSENESSLSKEKQETEEKLENKLEEIKTEQEAPQLSRSITYQGPRLDTQKIIEYIDNALENLKNGVEDDDARTNEISSLTNQLKFINKNVKKGLTNRLTNIFSNKGNSPSDLKHFLIKVLQGAPVMDHQIEKVNLAVKKLALQ